MLADKNNTGIATINNNLTMVLRKLIFNLYPILLFSMSNTQFSLKNGIILLFICD